MLLGIRITNIVKPTRGQRSLFISSWEDFGFRPSASSVPWVAIFGHCLCLQTPFPFQPRQLWLLLQSPHLQKGAGLLKGWRISLTCWVCHMSGFRTQCAGSVPLNGVALLRGSCWEKLCPSMGRSSRTLKLGLLNLTQQLRASAVNVTKSPSWVWSDLLLHSLFTYIGELHPCQEWLCTDTELWAFPTAAEFVAICGLKNFGSVSCEPVSPGGSCVNIKFLFSALCSLFFLLSMFLVIHIMIISCKSREASRSQCFWLFFPKDIAWKLATAKELAFQGRQGSNADPV